MCIDRIDQPSLLMITPALLDSWCPRPPILSLSVLVLYAPGCPCLFLPGPLTFTNQHAFSQMDESHQTVKQCSAAVKQCSASQVSGTAHTMNQGARQTNETSIMV